MRTHIVLYSIDRTYGEVTEHDIRPILVRVDLIEYADGVTGHTKRMCDVSADPEVRAIVQIKNGPRLDVNMSVEELAARIDNED